MLISNRNIIRFFSGLTFLIFFCPFFQMCSDQNILSSGKELALDNSLSIKENDSIEKNFEEKKLIEGRKEYILNTYQITNKWFIEESPIEIFNHLNEIDAYGILCFPLFIILSFVGFLYSLKEKFSLVKNINFLNIILVLLSILFFYLKDGLLEDVKQIKIGYYLFLLNSILIIYFCRKELKLSK